MDMSALTGDAGACTRSGDEWLRLCATTGETAASRARQLANADLVGDSSELTGLATMVSIGGGQCETGPKTVREGAPGALPEDGRNEDVDGLTETRDGSSAAMKMRERLCARVRP